MAVLKLSQIAAAGGPPAVTDTAVFVTGGTTDNLVTVTQLAAGLPAFTSTLKGSVPASGGGTTNFLRADGSFAPPTAAPGGSPGQVEWNSAGAFAGMTGSSWDDTNRALTLTGTTITANHPTLSLSQTWNAGGVTFQGLLLSVTSTASAAASKVFDFQTNNGVNSGTFLSANSDGSVLVNQVGQALTGIPLQVQFQGTGGVLLQVSASGSGSLALGTNFPNFIITMPVAGPINWSGASGVNNSATGVVGLSLDGTRANTGWLNYAGELRVASNQTFTSNVTLTTVMSVALQAGRTYSFKVYFSLTGSAGGFQAAIAATGGLTATDLRYDGFLVDNAAGGTKGAAQASAFGTAVANPATITGPASAFIYGTITVGVAGTFNVQAAQATSSGTSTVVLRGSYCWIHDMP